MNCNMGTNVFWNYLKRSTIVYWEHIVFFVCFFCYCIFKGCGFFCFLSCSLMVSTVLPGNLHQPENCPCVCTEFNNGSLVRVWKINTDLSSAIGSLLYQNKGAALLDECVCLLFCSCCPAEWVLVSCYDQKIFRTFHTHWKTFWVNKNQCHYGIMVTVGEYWQLWKLNGSFYQ